MFVWRAKDIVAIDSRLRAKNEEAMELGTLEYNDNLDMTLDTKRETQLLEEDIDRIEACTFIGFEKSETVGLCRERGFPYVSCGDRTHSLGVPFK